MTQFFPLLLLLLPLVANPATAEAAAHSAEARLVAKLLAEPQPLARIARPPAAGRGGDGNGTVVMLDASLTRVLHGTAVMLDASLTRVLRVKGDMVTIDMGVSMVWRDRRLEWSPADYDGLTSVALPTELLWTPDIRDYWAPKFQLKQDQQSWANVVNDGYVAHRLPVTMEIMCDKSRDSTELSCPIKLASWVHSGGQLNFDLGKPTLLGGVQEMAGPGALRRGAWEVVSADGGRRETKYACCPDPFVSAQYQLKLKRKTQRRKSRRGRG